MELRSGRSLKRLPPPPHHGGCCQRQRGPDVQADRISALPDEMLLLVLAHLGCVYAAVHTSLLSRRWRGLWTGLTDLTFRRLAPTTTKAVLARFARASMVSLHHVRLPYGQTSGAQANSLLCSAARLSPGKLVFSVLQNHLYPEEIEVPCFPSTTSIDLDTRNFPLELPAAGEFATLERLFLSGRIVGLGDWLNRCPRLRVISVDVTYQSERLVCVMPPPVHEFTALESLSLTGKIDGLDSFLNLCRRLRVLSVTYMDSRQLSLPSDCEFPVLEKLSLSGNIIDLTTSLNRCPRLRILRITFKGLILRCLVAALAGLEDSGPFDFNLSLLGFKDIKQGHDNNSPAFATLLGIAARLSPQEFLFDGCSSQITTQPLPSFSHTTSIQINVGPWLILKPLLDSDFSDLVRLSLSCNIVNLDTLVSLCPRLHELRVTETRGDIKLHSASLQKLYISTNKYMPCRGIDILTPMLKQLELVTQDEGNMSVSISAPWVEKVWWERFYAASAPVFRFLSLRCLRLQAAQDPGSLGVLCLYISASKHVGAKRVFTKQMEAFLVADFSVLEVHLERASEHRFGALLICLFRMRRIQEATKRLKVVPPGTLQWMRTCQGRCPCDGTKKGTDNQNIYSTCLEEVEMENFNGDDCEHDFLTLILGCSPMLKRVSLKLSTADSCTTEVDNIILAYPSVNCYVYFPSGKLDRRVSS